MSNHSVGNKKIIICFTGMPGAGKSTAAAVSGECGFKALNMGDFVRDETRRRGLSLNEDNVGMVMKDIRRKGDNGAVARLMLPNLRSIRSRYVTIDGARSIEEIEIFKEIGNVKILAIHSSPYNRFNYQKYRGREDAPSSWLLFKERDNREIEVGVGKLIALADEVIANNDISIVELRKETRKLLEKWRKKIED